MPVRRTCPCPTPPGGSVECDIDQVAVCSVIDGSTVRECRSPEAEDMEGYEKSILENNIERRLRYAFRLVDWTVEIVIRPYSDIRRQVDSTDLQVLLSGFFFGTRGRSVRFSLPRLIVLATQDLVLNGIPRYSL